jgi:hypothetical protein
LNHLEPPAPVIVMKDLGGFVADYQSQTAIYRASERVEVKADISPSLVGLKN